MYKKAFSAFSWIGGLIAIVAIIIVSVSFIGMFKIQNKDRVSVNIIDVWGSRFLTQRANAYLILNDFNSSDKMKTIEDTYGLLYNKYRVVDDGFIRIEINGQRISLSAYNPSPDFTSKDEAYKILSGGFYMKSKDKASIMFCNAVRLE